MNKKFLMGLLSLSFIAYGMQVNYKEAKKNLNDTIRTLDTAGIFEAFRDKHIGNSDLFFGLEENIDERTSDPDHEQAKKNLKKSIKTLDLTKISEALSNQKIGEADKSWVLQKALIMGKNDTNLNEHDFNVERLKVVRFLIDNGANVNWASDKTPLYLAILYHNPEIVKILLTTPGIRVKSSDLEFAKKRYFQVLKDIEESQPLEQSRMGLIFDQASKEILKKEKQQLGEIIRMLVKHLSIYTGQGCISTQGITGVYNLPPEMAEYIAPFIHD